VWLVIPAALGVFALRIVLVARRLRMAAQLPMTSDARALREAQEALRAHRERLEQARAAPKKHLAEAKRLSRFSVPRVRAPATGVDAMVEDYLPERRL
jgi:hypothetical protein